MDAQTMDMYTINEQAIVAEYARARVGAGSWAMLTNLGLNGILFVIGLIMCNTAPSAATDPACQTGAYHACMLGDPQAVNGFLLCAGAIGLFVVVSIIIGLVVGACALARVTR